MTSSFEEERVLSAVAAAHAYVRERQKRDLVNMGGAQEGEVLHRYSQLFLLVLPAFVDMTFAGVERVDDASGEKSFYSSSTEKDS